MNAKEFDMFMALLLSMLEDGKTEEVIRIIKDARGKEQNNDKKSDKKD